jgi:hypothetical protein
MALQKTTSAHGSIAVVFDFDDTLAADSTSSFLESRGIGVRKFWKDHAQQLVEGWDPVPGYLSKILAYSHSMPATKRITRKLLQAYGPKVKFHPGVKGIFSRIRAQVRGLHPALSVQFFIVSSGIGEILRATDIAHEFTDIWASDFSYNSKGEIEFIKNVVSFTDKTRFLFQISKGMYGPEARKDPFAVNRRIEESERRVQMNHIIMVGDGFTDVPCFSLVQRSGGIAIGVYDRESRERWGKAFGFIEDKRVSHLVAADFRKRSGLDDALQLAVDRIGHDILLQKISYRG